MTQTSPTPRMKEVLLNTGEYSPNEGLLAHFTTELADLYRVKPEAIYALARYLRSENIDEKTALMLNWGEVFKKSNLVELGRDGGIIIDPEAEKIARAMLRDIFNGGKFLKNPLSLGHAFYASATKLMQHRDR